MNVYPCFLLSHLISHIFHINYDIMIKPLNPVLAPVDTWRCNIPIGTKSYHKKLFKKNESNCFDIKHQRFSDKPRRILSSERFKGSCCVVLQDCHTQQEQVRLDNREHLPPVSISPNLHVCVQGRKAECEVVPAHSGLTLEPQLYE